jgi:RND family efflux transporter MFP subunit
MSQPDRNPGRPAPRRLRLVGGAFVVLAVAIVAYGLVSRAAQNSRLHDLTQAQALPSVAIVAPTQVENHAGLDLPGRLEAYIRAPIYARVPGYLKSWKHDIGGKVKAGDVLAEIDTPDLDQQLMQARADLSVAQANAKLAQIGAERWQALAGTDAVAKQDVDQRTFTFNANIAQVKAAQANVDRLVAEEGFKHLIAPFDGIVTARETDIGALINAGSAGNARELFSIADTHKVRVYVKVPQRLAGNIHRGLTAELRLPQYPGKVFTAKATTTSRSVNTSSRTLLVELQADNSEGLLQPGTYVEAQLNLPSDPNVMMIPASAILFRQHGLEVAVVGDDNKVTLKKISLGRNLGVQVEVSGGLMRSDAVVDSPPDSLGSGDLVRIAGHPAPGNPTDGSEKEAEAS